MRPLGRFGVGGIDGISGTAGKMKYCNATRRGGVGPGWRQSVHGARQSERRIGLIAGSCERIGLFPTRQIPNPISEPP